MIIDSFGKTFFRSTIQRHFPFPVGRVFRCRQLDSIGSFICMLLRGFLPVQTLLRIKLGWEIKKGSWTFFLWRKCFIVVWITLLSPVCLFASHWSTPSQIRNLTSTNDLKGRNHLTCELWPKYGLHIYIYYEKQNFCHETCLSFCLCAVCHLKKSIKMKLT